MLVERGGRERVKGNSESPNYDLSTKLLVGAIIGIGVGLIGLATGFSSGEKLLFLVGSGDALFGLA